MAAPYHPSHWDQVLWRHSPWAAAPGCPCSAWSPQMQHFRRPCSSCNSGVRGVIYIPQTLAPLKSLGLFSRRVKKLAHKLHAHSVRYACMLVQTRRSLEHYTHLRTNQERSAGLSACKPLGPHWDAFFFSGEGLFFPSGPFSLIDVRSFFAACAVSPFFFFSFWWGLSLLM